MPLNEEENDDGTPLIKENKTMVKPLSKVKRFVPVRIAQFLVENINVKQNQKEKIKK